MKKNTKIVSVIALLLVVIVGFSLFFVINKNKGDNGTMELDSTDVGDFYNIQIDSQVVNPFEYFNSIEAVNGITGTGINKCSLDGITDETFAVIDAKISEHKFTYNNVEFCARGAKTEDDISGIYTGDGTISDLTKEDDKIVSADGTLFIRWHSNGVQYILTASTTNEDLFETVYENIK